MREALTNEGFGILTEIDVKEKMKEKLGLDMNKYIILGACNPANAYKAILTEENIGLMLDGLVKSRHRKNFIQYTDH